MMDFSEALLCASMKNILVKLSIWMVHLKWIEILEWTTSMSEQSLYAWKFHHLPSDLARRGWRLLLIGEYHHATINEVLSKMIHQHCYASINISIHHDFTIHRLFFSLVFHLHTILIFPFANYSSSSTILEFSTCKLLFPFDIWSPPSIDYCFPNLNFDNHHQYFPLY